MKDGHILQVGTPTELYETPVDIFTARFIGSPSMNLLRGTRAGDSVAPSATGELLIGVRPHDLLVGESGSAQGTFTLEGTVTAVEPLGPAAGCNARRREVRFIFSTPRRKSFWAAHDDNGKNCRHQHRPDLL